MDAFALLLQRNRQRYPERVAIRIKKIEDSRPESVLVLTKNFAIIDTNT